MTFSVIFDMNGVIIDDIPFHKKAWGEFCRKLGRIITDEEFEKEFSGMTNHATITKILGREITEGELANYELEKEMLYQEIYTPHRALVPGLLPFLGELAEKAVPMSVATSAPPVNIPFILDELKIRKFFQSVIDASMITKGKPDPEMFLVAAKTLKTDPKDCVVFEDSHLGLEAASSAGMKTIGVGTTHTALEFKRADLVISDFTDIKYQDLVPLFT